MVINWFILLPALVALLLPLERLLRARIRARDYESLRHQNMKPVRDVRRQPWLWLDVARGWGGAFALRHAWTLTEDAAGTPWRFAPVAATLVILLVGVRLQMRSRRLHDVMFAPLGYCAGVAFALVPPAVSLLTVVFALASLIAFRGWWAFFFWGAVASGGLGYLILGKNLWMITTTLVFAAPLVFSWFSHRPLRLPLNRVRVRKVSSADDANADDANADDTAADESDKE